MADALSLLRSIGETLDGLGLAACVFDDDDAALVWNRTFLKFFPEHEPHIHVGEPYRANLRRFYEARLRGDELLSIERYIDQGVARHRTQSRPFTFMHGTRRYLVSSLPLPGVGRIRIWRPDETQPEAPAETTPAIEGAALLDHVPDGVMVCSPDNTILWVNEPFVLMYGLRGRSAAVGKSFGDVYRAAWGEPEAAEREPFDFGLGVLAENMRLAGAPFEMPLPNRRWSRVIAQRSPDGKGFYAHVDITELKRQQRRLEDAERRARESQSQLQDKSKLLEATLERMEQGVMMVNAQRVVEVCNRRAIELLGLPPQLMASRPTFEAVLQYQWSTDEFRHTPQELQEFVRAGGILDRPHSYDRQRPDGRVMEVQSVPIEGGGVLRTYTDITDRKRNEERMRHVARHDALTSLVNRDVLFEYLGAAVADARRDGTGFAVHYIDLDGFKPVNDRYGHATGDKLLAAIAERMRKVARDVDVVARMGGDEFAILQRGVSAREAQRALANRLLDSVSQPIEIDAHCVQVGASIGIALWPTGGEDPESLLRSADKAMYEAKSAGRHCVRIFGSGVCDP